MCEIITIIAALAFTAVWFFQKKAGKSDKAVFLTMLMFWGAALMWACDGIASVLEGEGFFDISREDTILGFIILAFGLGVFAVYSAVLRLKIAKK